MGFCGGRRKAYDVRPEQKWDYISLKDFKSSSGFTVAAYIYVYVSILISLAVYGIDSFTAVSLLAFGKWTSSINPNEFIDFSVQKWIFSVCIIASFVNLGFEHIRAWRVMKRGSVAECYLDNLAVKMESTRMGQGQGWRRFLVFAELTKSKKGAEYVALFTYFSFQSWIRVIFCSGPRQFVNALTIYAVFTSELLPTEGGSADRTIMSFFEKIGALANESYQQAAVLSGMVFTLIIWIFSALSLLLAALFYIFFLWHYIPRQDGGLSGYCERKTNKRLMKIVAVKVNKAIAKEEQQRVRAQLKAAKKAGVEKPPVGRQATLPTIPNLEPKKDDSLPGMPMLSRNDTMATLPAYTSRPGSPGSIEMNSLDQKRPMPQRSGTSTTLASQSSYSSRAPLMGSAAGMGYDRSASPVPTLPQVDLNNYPPVRPGTAQSNRSFAQGPLHRAQNSNGSNFGASYSQSPSVYQGEQMPTLPQPVRSPTANSMDSYGRQGPRPMNQFGSGPRPGPAGRPFHDDGMSGRASPAPSNFSNRPDRPMYDNGFNSRASPAPPNFSNRGPPMNRPGYNGPPVSPMRSATGPVYSPNRPQFPPQRNMTAPIPPRQDDYMARPGTAASQRSMPMSMPRPGFGPGPGQGPGYGYDHDVESQRGPPQW